MIPTPGNLKQTETQRLEVTGIQSCQKQLSGEKASVIPISILPKLGYRTFDSLGHPVSFPYVPHVFLLNLGIFFPFKFIVSIGGDNNRNLDKHIILNSNYIQFFPVET